MKKFINVLLATLMVVAGIANPASAQTPERGRLVVPSSTSSSWFRAAATPTDCSAPQFSITGDTDNGLAYVAANTIGLAAGGACRVTISPTAVTSTVPVVSKQDIGSISAWDNGQFVIQGATDTAKGISLGFSTTDNYGYLYAREVGVSVRPLLTQPSGGAFTVGLTGAQGAGLGSTVFQIGDTYTFGWSDVSISRDGAGILAQKSGTNAQAFRVYGTTTGPRYTTISHDGSDGRITTASGGNLIVEANSGGVLRLGDNALQRWQINAGHFLAVTDNTYDIGANGASRPRDYFGAGSISIVGNITIGATDYLKFAGSSEILGTGDGIITLRNHANTGFTRLILGTNDANGISLYKNGTRLDFKTGDQVSFIDVVASSFTAIGALSSTSPTAGIGYATGAGGTVTQLTSKSTGVTLNTVTGNITMNAAALAAGATVSFTLTSSAIVATDYIMVQHISGGTVGAYIVQADGATGSAIISVTNRSAGSLSEAVILKFVVIKAVTS